VVGSIVVLSLSSFMVAMMPDPTSPRIMGAFMWLAVPILWCSVFLSVRETAVILSFYFIGIALLPLLNSALAWQMVWGALGFVLTVGITVLIVMHQRNLIARDQQVELRANEEQLRLAMSAGELGTWNWDFVTNRVDWSPETERIFGLKPGDFDHTSEMYQNLIYPTDLPAVQQAVRTTIANPDADYIVHHRVLLPDNNIRWVEGRGKVLCNENGTPIRFTGTAIDITLRHQYENEKERFLIELEVKNEELKLEITSHQATEMALRQSEEFARQFQQQLIALQEVSIELAEAQTFDELCRKVVELGRSRLHFDRLSMWFLDEDPAFMVGSFGTDEQGNVRDERHQRLPAGPVDVFDNVAPSDFKKKSWRRNALYDDAHNSIGDGWNAIAPLWRGNRVIGYISVDNYLEKRPFSQELIELLSLYATSISHLVIRKQAEVKAVQRRDMLEKVVELGKRVTQVADLRECLMRIHESIQNGLGFDRVGLFLVDEPNELILGSYGTDREGHITEEWGVNFSLSEISLTGQMLHASENLIFVQDYEAHFGSGEGRHKEDMEGVKQHARVVAFVGEQPVAILNADNAINERLITEEQVEALHLFAGYAGLAIENARLLAQVKEAEYQYRSIFENAIEGIFQVVPRGGILSANPALAHMLGYESPEQLIAEITDISTQIYSNPERPLELKKQVLAHGWVQNFEFAVSRPDGSQGWLSQNVRAVYDDMGEILYLEGTVQDVTDRKRVEEERKKLIQELENRNAELERFTYTVSHDLKSPLITIQGFLGFVEQDALSGNIARLKEDIVHITEATGNMQRLLNELLELSRVGRLTNPSEMVSFAELVDEALMLVSGQLMNKGVQMIVAPNLPEVYVDRHRLVEVLQNLLDNAAKFMGDQAEPRIEIGMELEGDESIFFVRDNGVGISPNYQETIFGLFERLDQSVEGTGIGLALARRIIEVHNGRLWVESMGNRQGATFYFTLPMVSED